MKKILVNIASLNLLRSSWHRITNRFTDAKCRAAFIRRMNEKSRQLGMDHTEWINPSGVGENGSYSRSTARDLALMAVNAYQNDILKEIWNKKEASILIRKPFIVQRQRLKNKIVSSTVPLDSLGGKYRILGAKTGSGDGYQTLVMVCEVRHQIVAGAIMNANDEEGRFTAMTELMSIAENKLAEPAGASPCAVTSAKNACAYLIENGKAGECLYAQDADMISAPMSTTKVMTLLTALDYLNDVSKMVYITPGDFIRCNSDVLHPWEKVSLQDIMCAAMLPSSNVAANALARIAGSLILYQQ